MSRGITSAEAEQFIGSLHAYRRALGSWIELLETNRQNPSSRWDNSTSLARTALLESGGRFWDELDVLKARGALSEGTKEIVELAELHLRIPDVRFTPSDAVDATSAFARIKRIIKAQLEVTRRDTSTNSLAAKPGGAGDDDLWHPGRWFVDKGWVSSDAQLTKLAKKDATIRRKTTDADRERFNSPKLQFLYHETRVYRMTEGRADTAAR